MFQAEYINSFNHNYLKVKQNVQQGKKLRYQYQILTMRKLEGLLPVNMHISNGEYGLYYEISAKQSLSKWLLKEKIGRSWMEKFVAALQTALWSTEQYLLDNRNLIMAPDYIFQDMETEKISFVYMPYLVESDANGMDALMAFLIQNANETEEDTVTLLYDIFSKWEILREQFTVETFLHLWQQGIKSEEVVTLPMEEVVPVEEAAEDEDEDIYVKKKDLGEFFFGKSKKMKVAESGNENVGAVREESLYERTTYMEIAKEEQERKLYGNGKQNRKVIDLEKLPVVIGKKGEKADVTLSDASISRMHARLSEENGQVFLEDLNATNGTFKNGVRLKPYERVELDREDEVKLGKMSFTYR